MPTANTHLASPAHHGSFIEIAGSDLVFGRVPLTDRTPTGAQIADAAGYSDTRAATVLHLMPNGELEDIRPTEVVSLPEQGERFIVVASDRFYRLSIDGRRLDWPVRCISGAILRHLGRVASDRQLFIERQDQADKEVQDDDVVDLDQPGVETFYSRPSIWVLNVQGVRLEVPTPTIIVSDALSRAGFDANQGWHIFLKVAGRPKEALELTSIVDLRTPGIEKIRLTPKDVNNGERATPHRKGYPLLPVDEAHLDERFAYWETLIENGRRWLLIHGFPVPEGYNARRCTLALEVPPSYPVAQIDMFYALPALTLETGVSLPNTEATVSIDGQVFQRWSRHRGPGSEWLSGVDNVMTHLALVESSLLKEVSE